MHESLYAATGKRLTYVLNVAARAMTKHALNVHAGHDDYHAVDDTGFFQLFAKSVQEAGDFSLIAHRIAELSLTPGINAQDGFLTSHVLESVRLVEPAAIARYLGDPADEIECPTPAQRLTFGPTRRRVPELFSVDYPAMLGTVQNQDAYAQGVAAQRPFYFDHVAELTDRAMAEFAELTGRAYARAGGYRLDDAEYVLAGQGSIVPNLELAADWLRAERDVKVGVLNVTMFRPFPADLITAMLAGTKGVTVFERCDQPLAVDPPLLREIRAAMTKALENGRARGGNGAGLPFPGIAAIAADDIPNFHSAGFGFGSRDVQPGDIVAATGNMLPAEKADDSSTSESTSSERERAFRSCASGRNSSWTRTRGSTGSRWNPRGDQPPPAGLDLDPYPLGGWLGRHHDGQEPHDDGVRALRDARQGEPEVWF